MKLRSAELVEVAARLFRHYGFEKTSMSDIAAEAQISRTALYNHFHSKDALFEAIAIQLFEQFQAEVAKAQALGQISARLFHILAAKRVFLNFLRGSKHGAALLQRGHRQLGELSERVKGEYIAGLAKELEAGRRAGVLSFDQVPATIAVALTAANEGLWTASVEAGEDETIYVERIGQFLDLMLRGLIPR